MKLSIVVTIVDEAEYAIGQTTPLQPHYNPGCCISNSKKLVHPLPTRYYVVN